MDRKYQRVHDAWLATLGSVNTRAAYRLDMVVVGRWCATHEKTPLTVDAQSLTTFQDARAAAGDSLATIRRRWSTLNSFYAYAVSRGEITVNPAIAARRRPRSGDPVPTRPTNLDAAAATRYRNASAAIDPRLHALVSLLTLDGIKLGEALALDVSDVKGRPPRMSITIAARGLRVVLADESARALRRTIAARRSGPVFINAREGVAAAQRLSRFGADHLIRQLAPHGNRRVTTNDLRASHLGNIDEAGRTSKSSAPGGRLREPPLARR